MGFVNTSCLRGRDIDPIYSQQPQAEAKAKILGLSLWVQGTQVLEPSLLPRRGGFRRKLESGPGPAPNPGIAKCNGGISMGTLTGRANDKFQLLSLTSF